MPDRSLTTTHITLPPPSTAIHSSQHRTMGLLDHVNSAVSGARSAVGHSPTGPKVDAENRPLEGASADDTEELDEESGNILLSLIGQLRIGMDLSKVTLPTFCLEPRSMLERITVSLTANPSPKSTLHETSHPFSSARSPISPRTS